MNTHLKYYCFVLFLLLFVSCNASSKKKTNEQQTTEQVPQTAQVEDTQDGTIDCLYINQQRMKTDEYFSEKNAFIPRFAMIDLTGTRLLYNGDWSGIHIDEDMAKRYTHCIYEGKVFPVKFEKKQEISPDWITREFNSCFDDMGGLVFSVTEGCLLSQEELAKGWSCDALLVDENYLNGLEIIPIAEVYNSAEGEDSYEDYEIYRGTWLESSEEKKYDPVPANIADYYTTQFNRQLEGCFMIAKAGDIVFYKVLFISDEGDRHLAFVIDDGNQVVGEKFGDIYFADGGEFSISYISMLMKKNGTYQIIEDSQGSEMINTILLEVRDNELKTTGIKSYRYTAPM